MRKVSVSMVFLLLSFLFIMAGCNSKNATTEMNHLERIQEAGVIIVGMSTTGPPFSYLNSETNELDGFMVDVAKKIGEELGVEVELNGMKFSSLIPSLETNKIDMVSAGMVINEERKKVVDFTEPIYFDSIGFIVAEDNEDIKTFDDLMGKKVGVQQATNTAEKMTAEYPEVQLSTYKSIADMMTELQHERIEAFMGDHPILHYMMKQNPEFKGQLFKVEEPGFGGDIGVAVPKGSAELLDAVNEAVNRLRESGELEALMEKWEF